MQAVTWILAYVVAVFATCEADTLQATCSMTGVSAVSTEKISGTVNFEQESDSSTVTIKVDLTGFDNSDTRTQHGFHVHQTGSTGSNCADAGSHFNPGSTNHGGPTDTIRHVGDLGNVDESNGKVVKTFTDSKISLKSDSTNYIIGRAIVIHQDPDDLGDGGIPASLTTGNAGSRIGCCVITESSGARSVAFSVGVMAVCMVLLALLQQQQ